VYGLEFTPRFGYDASPTLFFELIQNDLGSFFEAAARGRIAKLDLREGFAGALRVTIPPWPTERYHAEENVPLRGIDEKTMERSLYLYNVKRDDNNNLCTAGAWGIVGLFTSHSSNPERALAWPLDACKELRLKNKQYRTDLGKQFVKDIEELEALSVDVNPAVEVL
jgi:phosphoribosylamine-glycine ligase